MIGMMKISIAKIILSICCLSAAIFPENCPVNVIAEQTGTIRHEAEDATLTDCVRSESVAYQNASGQAGVESIDYSTSRVEFQITVEETAKYLLTVGYCTANANATLVSRLSHNFMDTSIFQ